MDDEFVYATGGNTVVALTVMTAQEVPKSSVNGPVASFDDAPAVWDALFEEDNCETTSDGSRVCGLSLRGSGVAVEAVRFMARHGVRCPYRTTGGHSDAFVAEHDGTYYRVTCSPSPAEGNEDDATPPVLPPGASISGVSRFHTVRLP